MLVWSLTTLLVLMHPQMQPTRDPGFISKVLESAISLLSHSLISTHLFSSLTTGLELMVLHFSLSYAERSHLTTVAANMCVGASSGHNFHSLLSFFYCGTVL